MASPTTDRRLGLVGNTAIKVPVACATTANITLSGEQTIDGVLTSASRVLVKNQTDQTQNGLYDSSSAAWTRCLDSNGNYDLVTGTIVDVAGGTTQGGTFWGVTTTNPITIGTSLITWALSLTASISSFSYIATGTGAISRTALAKMRETYSSTDYTGRGSDNWGLGTGVFAVVQPSGAGTGVQMVAIGTNALAAVTTAFASVAVGHHALSKLATACYCTAVGAYALENAELPGNVNLLCTAVGAYAGNQNTIGQYLTAVGAYAGQNNTTGNFNTFLGQNAGTQNTTGSSNTFVGHGAGQLITGASSSNTIVGEIAGTATTTATGMCLFGFEAGTNNVTGTWLHAFGYAAAAQSTGGLGTAFGKQAAYSVTSNTGWCGFGYEAGINVTGANWTALGHQAMGGAGANYSGAQTAVGYRAAYLNAAAYDNTTALGANSTNTRSNQIMLGDSGITEVRTAGVVVQHLVATGSTPLDNNREFAFYVLDDTHINFKMKGSDGTVRSATGAFATGGFVLA